uniref:Coiled-coil domain-containing protein 153 n=1 Tax=Caenorhabditis tropicalis TaxID=1561998 RepID=A0A1I7UM10_9PELO
MSRGSGSSGATGKRKKIGKRDTRKKSSPSSENSGRGERERTKWRTRKREQELKKAEDLLNQKKIQSEEEAARRKSETQKKEVKKYQEEIDKVLLESVRVQKSVEDVMSDYRESKNTIRFQLSTQTNEIIQTQHLEKSHLTTVADRIRFSEVELSKLEYELNKTKQIRDDYIYNSQQPWYIRLWKYLY